MTDWERGYRAGLEAAAREHGVNLEHQVAIRSIPVPADPLAGTYGDKSGCYRVPDAEPRREEPVGWAILCEDRGSRWTSGPYETQEAAESSAGFRSTEKVTVVALYPADSVPAEPPWDQETCQVCCSCGGTGKVMKFTVIPASSVPASSCPCTVPGVEPCDPRCTCVTGASSRGCRCCAAYGSLEQRQVTARRIIEDSKPPNAAEKSSAGPAGNDVRHQSGKAASPAVPSSEAKERERLFQRIAADLTTGDPAQVPTIPGILSAMILLYDSLKGGTR